MISHRPMSTLTWEVFSKKYHHTRTFTFSVIVKTQMFLCSFQQLFYYYSIKYAVPSVGTKIGIKLKEVLSYGYFLMQELIAEDKFNSKDVNARNTMLSLASIFGTRTITSTLDLLDNSISNYKVRRWKQNTFEGTHISENDTIVTEFVTDSSQRILYQVSSRWIANPRVICQ